MRKESIECVLYNVRSVKSINKRAHLAEILSSERYSVVALTETWCNNSISDCMLVSDPRTGFSYPYNVVRKDRTDGVEGGGVCALVHKNIRICPVETHSVFQNLEFLSFDILSQSEPVIRFICVYRTPSGTVEQRRDIAKLLRNCLLDLCTVDYYCMRSRRL